MFLKIINNNLSYMNSTTVYEMDNIEYFSLPLWEVTFNNWEEQVQARKEYARITAIKKETETQYNDELSFVRQMNPMPSYAFNDEQVVDDRGFDELGVKMLINWASSLQPHWFSYKHSHTTPVLLYVDRHPIQLLSHNMLSTQMPHMYFIRLIHKNPEDDVIIITNMNKVYLQSENGKTIEKLSKREELDKNTQAELQKNYCTKEFFEYYYTKQYNAVEDSLRRRNFFNIDLSSTEIERLEKKLKERRESLETYWDAVCETNNKYASQYWETNEDKKEDKKEEQIELPEQNNKDNSLILPKIKIGLSNQKEND